MTQIDDSSRWTRAYIVAGAIGYAALALYDLAQRRPPFFDESYHLLRATRLASNSSLIDWLNENTTSAPGPLFAMLHFTLSGGRGYLPVPWLRMVNVALLVAVIAALSQVLVLVGRRRWAVWSIMGVPMTWVFSGMAITEMPAMVGAAAALWAAVALGACGLGTSLPRPVLAIVLAGGVVVATCGRQSYLVIVPALFVLAGGHLRSLAVPALILGIAPLLCLFTVWHGVVPPAMAEKARAIRIDHALYAFTLAGVMSLMIAPRFVWEHRKWAAPAVAIAVIANACTNALHFTTLTSVQRMVQATDAGHLVDRAAGVFFVAAGGAFVVAVCRQAVKGRNREFCGLALGVFLLCAVCAAASREFSSRYSGMALPFMVVMLAPWIEPGPWSLALLAFGMALSAAVLHSYFLFG